MKTNSKLKMVCVVVVSLVLGVALGWLLALLIERRPAALHDASRERQDLLLAYHLLTTALEDESDLDRLGLLKTITFDRPPEEITHIMAQVSDAADTTVEQLDHYRELSPRIERLPQQQGFGEILQDAMKKDTTSSLMDRSPKFSKRLLLSQAQALGMIVVLAKEIEKIDPNKDRREWLLRVSRDFETMYDAYLQNLRFVAAG